MKDIQVHFHLDLKYRVDHLRAICLCASLCSCPHPQIYEEMTGDGDELGDTASPVEIHLPKQS